MIDTPSVDWLALSPTLALLAVAGGTLLGAVLVPRAAERAFSISVSVAGFGASAVLAGWVFDRSPEPTAVVVESMTRDRLGALAAILIALVGLVVVLLSAGDGHAAQGDGEVSQLAIEAPVERALLTLSVRDDLSLTAPIAWTPEAWLTFGFDEDLDEAAALAVDGMLQLMGREYGLERREALALASVAVDLRVTQLVNGAQGIHARLAHEALH